MKSYFTEAIAPKNKFKEDTAFQEIIKKFASLKLLGLIKCKTPQR